MRTIIVAAALHLTACATGSQVEDLEQQVADLQGTNRTAFEADNWTLELQTWE